MLFVWVLLHVAIFSFSETKQDLYVFPIVPALAALAACSLKWAIDEGVAWFRGAVVGTSVLMLVVAAGAFWLFGARALVHQIAGANLLAGVLAVGAVVSVALALRRRAQGAAMGIAATMVAANYVFALVSLPAVEAFKPVVPMVEVVNARTARDEPPPVVAHYRTVLPSMTYYLGRPIEDIFDMPTLVGRAQQVPEMYVLMRPDEYQDFHRAAGAVGVTACIASRHTLFEAKLRNVLEGRPWPEIYLAGVGEGCGIED